MRSFSFRCRLPRRQLGFLGIGSALMAVGDVIGGAIGIGGADAAAAGAGDFLSAGLVDSSAFALPSAGAASSGLGGVGSLLGGLGNYLGPAAAGAASYIGTQDTNRTNLQLVQMQNEAAMERQKATQDWEANMANTAEQRQVADLKAAGLNPMLAAHGPGAAVPNVAAPPVQAGQVQNALGGAVGTAMNTAQTLSNLKLQQEQIQATSAMADKTFADSQQSSWDAASKLIDLQEKKYLQGQGSWNLDLGNRINQNLMLDQQIQTEQKKQRLMDLEAQSATYDLNRQKNVADMNSSWIGRNILPWWDALGLGGRVGNSGFSASMGR